MFAFTIDNMLAGTPLEFMLGLPGGKPILLLSLIVLLFIVFEALSFVLLKILKFLAGRTKTTLDDEVLAVVGRYLSVLSVLLAVFLSLYSVYPEVTFGRYTEMESFLIVFFALLAFFAADLADVFMVWYGMRIQPKEHKISRPQVFPFVRTIVRILVYAIFAIFILQFAGFDTAALLTGLGVAGLAVALALQDTLGNFFAGIHILIDKPFREGDYIRLEDGKEGKVERIDWRSTKIITPEKNVVIVPNSKLSSAIIVNYSTPDAESGVSYEVGVSYDADVEEVEKAILDVLKTVAKENTYLVEGTAWARLERFGDFALIFKFGYQVNGYVNRFSVLKDVNRGLLAEFRKKKIEIPFPVRVIRKG